MKQIPYCERNAIEIFYPKSVVRILYICKFLLVYFRLTSRAFSELNNQEGGRKEAKENAKMKNSIVQIETGNISRHNDRLGFNHNKNLD